MELYQLAISPNAKRVRAVAAELGCQLDIKTLDHTKAEHKTPDYMKKNPMGKVPTLVDGDYVLWESPAICMYLAQKQGKLLSKDPRGLTDTVRWMTWNASHFEPPVFDIVFERMFKPMMGKEIDQPLVDKSLKSIERYAPVLDKQLTGRDWIVGELSIADFVVGSTFEIGSAVQIDFSPYKSLTSWFHRLRERPSWKA